ncbi:helix-turn-helix domain-containing protein [Brevibacillus daliensis]|uniref:helix-turn-helix domain-containing protein n=1 Tax=Brevibacillus daliensis TaxID=2892995 RepID=UPI001E2B2025|nr:helix-turn-helix domain-containing protein [Brevibacillus daliensis]
MTQVGKRLREFRKRLKMTQGDLAEGICNRSYVSQIEKGQVIPSPEILEQLAKRLQTEIKELWTESENPSFTLVEIQNSLRHIINRIDEQEWEIARKWLIKLQGASIPVSEEGVFLWAKGKIAEIDGRSDQAEEHYRNSIILTRENDNPTVLIRALDSLGHFYCEGNKPESAVSLLHEALQLLNRYEISGLLRISVLLHLGNMHVLLGEFYSAIEHLHHAQDLNKNYGILYRSGDLYLALGNCYQAIADYHNSELNFRQAASLFQIANQPIRLAEVNQRLGALFTENNQLDKAENSLKLALSALESSKDISLLNQTRIVLADVYRMKEQVSDAKELCQLVISTGDEKTLAEAQFILAEVMLFHGNEDEALIHLENARGYFTIKNMQKFLVKTYQLLGHIHLKNHRFEQAAKMYERSITKHLDA